MKDTVANMTAAQIPQDVQFFDIDYMSAFLDFTTNGTSFPTSAVTAFLKDLHNTGKHFIPIVDPGIR